MISTSHVKINHDSCMFTPDSFPWFILPSDSVRQLIYFSHMILFHDSFVFLNDSFTPFICFPSWVVWQLLVFQTLLHWFINFFPHLILLNNLFFMWFFHTVRLICISSQVIPAFLHLILARFVISHESFIHGFIYRFAHFRMNDSILSLLISRFITLARFVNCHKWFLQTIRISLRAILWRGSLICHVWFFNVVNSV